MKADAGNKKRTGRNLIIMWIVTVGIGWVSLGLNRAMGATNPEESLGMLLWLAAPLITTLLLRGFAGDGWRDMGLAPRPKTNLGWYMVSILFYPLSAALVLLIAGAFGAVSTHGLAGTGWILALQLVGMQTVFSLLKNVFEEFSWRGYLTPKLDVLGVHPLVNHMLVGLVWGAWHVPYWVGLISRASLTSFTHLALPLFIVMGVLALIASAVLHGELRLATGSVWPPFILHCIGNGVTLALLQDNLISMSGQTEIVFAPGTAGGILSILITALAGVAVYLTRTRIRSRAPRAPRM